MFNAHNVSNVLVCAGRSLLGRRRYSTGLLVAVLCAASCAQPIPKTQSTNPVTLRIGIGVPKTGEVTSGAKQFANNLVSDQLIGLGWDGQPVPRLVSTTSWSEDNLQLTLTLNQNLRFHDGTVINAAFLKPQLENFLKSSPISSRSVVSVNVDGEARLTIVVSRHEALLPAELSNFVPTHPTNPNIGSGPYRLVEGTPMRLEAVDGYYRGRPQIDVVEVQEYEEQRGAWAALMRGQLDAVHEISPGALEFVQAEGQTTVGTYPYTRPYFISLFYNSRHAALKSPKVRQALSYAVDRDYLIQVGLHGQGVPANGPIWPSHWAYTTPSSTYTRNLEAATLRLDSAGFPLRRISGEGQRPSRFRFRCITLARYETMALGLQRQLSDVGVDAEFQVVSPGELIKRMKSGDYDAILMERTSGRSLFWTYMLFHSKGMSLGYSSADAALDKFRSATAKPDLRDAVSDFQQILYDDPPALFIAWPQVARVVSSRFVVQYEKDRDVISNLLQWKASDVNP